MRGKIRHPPPERRRRTALFGRRHFPARRRPGYGHQYRSDRGRSLSRVRDLPRIEVIVGPGAWILVGLVLLVGLLTFAIRYADRAIRENRPGWTSPPEDRGLECPHAVGEKGAKGEPGREDHELQG